MKNAIKKMKWGILALGLVLGVGLALGLRADIKYFWLDHPTGRNNPNDPLSPLYASPTAKVTVPAGTDTDTPTISPTPTDTTTVTPPNTPTSTITPTDTPTALGTFTQTPTYSASPTTTLTFTASPTPTMTPTVQPAGWPALYGEYNGGTQSVTLTANDFSSGGTDGAVQVAGSGPGGSDFYADLTLSSATAGFSAAVDFSTGFWATSQPITQSTTVYAALSITVAVPPLTVGGTNPSLIVPGVSLVYNVTGETYTAQTVVLNLDNFVITGPQFIEPSATIASPTWYTAVVPLGLFGVLANSAGVTPTVTELQNVVGIDVQPVNYGQTGALTTELYVGSVIFNDAENILCPTNAGLNDFSGLFSDFEDGTADYWGGYWSTNFDGITSTLPAGTPCTGGTGTLIAPTYTGYGPITCGGDCWTVVSYGGVTDTVSAADSAGDGTPSHAAHFAGWFGNENGQYAGSGGTGQADCGTTAAQGSGDYPYLNMTANTYPTGAANEFVDLSNNTFITTLAGGGATGMSVELMPGVNNGPNQVYGVGIGTTTNSASAGNMWFFQVASSSLTAGQWTQFIVSFPPDGTMGGADGNPDPTGFHAQGGTDTELFFAQEEYSTYGAFSRNNVSQIEIESFLHNQPVDLYIDDIQFFSGAGPVAAHRAALVRVGGR